MTDRTAEQTPLDQTPLHAQHYADAAEFVTATIVANDPVARDTRRLSVEAPAIARRITPGQFVMVRLAGQSDPLLGRALALYAVDGSRSLLDVAYLVHGKFTSALATRRPGERVEVWGPLGNGFRGDDREVDRLVLVAGGIGYTPFLACAAEALGRARFGESTGRTPLRAAGVTLCYGVRSADLLAGVEDFAAAGVEVRVASDDGSVGHHGRVTDLVRRTLEESFSRRRRVLCCGPEPMMEAVAALCAAADVRCDVSLETPMACGLGVCFSCVAKVRTPAGSPASCDTDQAWDYKRTCVEGPVFDATTIEW